MQPALRGKGERHLRFEIREQGRIVAHGVYVVSEIEQQGRRQRFVDLKLPRVVVASGRGVDAAHDPGQRVELRGNGHRDAARAVVARLRVVVVVEVFARLPHLRGGVRIRKQGGNELVVGEADAHHFAGRSDDVVGAAAQVVEGLDVGHEAGVEDQVFGPRRESFEDRGQFGDVEFVLRVAERSRGQRPVGRRPVAAAEVFAVDAERAAGGRHPRFAVAADDDAVGVGRRRGLHAGEHLRHVFRIGGFEGTDRLQRFEHALSPVCIVADLLHESRTPVRRLIADDDPVFGEHRRVHRIAHALDVLRVEPQERGAREIDHDRMVAADGCGRFDGGSVVRAAGGACEQQEREQHESRGSAGKAAPAADSGGSRCAHRPEGLRFRLRDAFHHLYSRGLRLLNCHVRSRLKV